MGALVGSEGTDVTALEFWFFAPLDVVFLGRGGEGQAELEAGSPVCSSPLPTPQSINQRVHRAGRAPSQADAHVIPGPGDTSSLSSTALPARVSALSCWPLLRLSHALRHKSLGWGGSWEDAFPVRLLLLPAQAPLQAPVHTDPVVVVLTVLARFCSVGGHLCTGWLHDASWLASPSPFPKLLAQFPPLLTLSRKHAHAAAFCSTQSVQGRGPSTWNWPWVGWGEGVLALKHSQVMQCQAAQSEAGAGPPASQCTPQVRALNELGMRLNTCPVEEVFMLGCEWCSNHS